MTSISLPQYPVETNMPSSVNRFLQAGKISQWKRDLHFLNGAYISIEAKKTIKMNIKCNIFKRTISHAAIGGVVGGGVALLWVALQVGLP